MPKYVSLRLEDKTSGQVGGERKVRELIYEIEMGLIKRYVQKWQLGHVEGEGRSTYENNMISLHS